MSVINLENISKEYSIVERQDGIWANVKGLFVNHRTQFRAVENISFSVNQGEKVAYIGPNGAGKSTTIKMLSGILKPTDGKIDICGIEPYKNRQKHASNIGVIFGQRSQLWWDLPAIDSLELLACMYNVDHEVFKERLKMYDDYLGFGDFVNKPVRQLSLGQRVRVDFAASLIHNPPILLLDEPTIGMDVVAKDKVRKFINWVNDETNTTVLLTSHDMKDIEEICDRIIFINEGKIQYDGDIEQFKKIHQNIKYLVVEVEKGLRSLDVLSAKYEIEILDDKRAKFALKDYDDVRKAINEITEVASISDISVFDDDIDAIVKKMFEGKGSKNVSD